MYRLNLFRHIAWILFLCFGFDSNLYADFSLQSLYFGASGGYGKTTWQGLVPPRNRQNEAMAISTPTYVNEGGALWGLYAGYEFLNCFALEAAYFRFPDAKIDFDAASIFAFDHNGITSFISKTETISLMAKIKMKIPKSEIYAYSSLGAAEVHRSDEINNHWQASPAFGAGLNYDFSEHIISELGAIYIAGKGQSELNPAEDYFPFLYSVFIRLGYRF